MLKDQNSQEIFMQHHELIEENSKKYTAIDLDLNEIIRELEQRNNGADVETEDDEEDNDMLNVYN